MEYFLLCHPGISSLREISGNHTAKINLSILLRDRAIQGFVIL